MKLTGEKLDFAISQYVDGTLSEIDRRALEERLLTDAEARLHVTEEAHLTNVLRDIAYFDQPNVDFDKLQAHLSSVISDEPSHAAQPIKLHHAMPWVRRLSIAAALAIVAVVGYRFVPTGGGSVDAPAGTAFVAGPSIETATASAEIKITVGPSDVLAKRGQTLSVADETVYTVAPRVVISAGNASQMAMDSQPLY